MSEGFERRAIRLEPGARLDHADPWWQDALVLLAAGELDVECACGDRHRFRAGDLLTLARLRVVRAHNPGTGPACVLAVRRAPR